MLENCLVYVLTKKLESILTETEPIYGTKFLAQAIPDDLRESFEKPDFSDFDALVKEKVLEIGYPPRNPFIPSEIGMIEKVREDSLAPDVLLSDQRMIIWHLPITQFKYPKIYTKI